MIKYLIVLSLLFLSSCSNNYSNYSNVFCSTHKPFKVTLQEYNSFSRETKQFMYSYNKEGETFCKW